MRAHVEGVVSSVSDDPQTAALSLTNPSTWQSLRDTAGTPSSASQSSGSMDACFRGLMHECSRR